MKKLSPLRLYFVMMHATDHGRVDASNARLCRGDLIITSCTYKLQ